MEWWLLLTLIFMALLILLGFGVPVAFAFLVIDVVCAFLFWNGAAGLNQLVLSVMDSVTHFTLLPVPLFVLMGELLFGSGIATRQIEVLDSWLGRVPGRLSIMAAGGGAVFSTLTGSAIAGTATLGKILVPEMEGRGYKKPMTIGPILGSGGLAIMIPPSALGVLLAGVANISVGDFLIAIIVPGLLMASLYVFYIVIRCRLQPELAPAYEQVDVPLWPKLRNTIIYIFPMVVIVFLVIGLIILGIATPTEAAALGTLGSFILAVAYGGLDWDMFKRALQSTLSTTVMMFMILVGSMAFSQILAFTGASAGLASLAAEFEGSPAVIVLIMQVVQLMLGAFMEPLSIVVLTVPIFFPIIEELGLSPVWFGVLMLLNMQMATTSPPFGLGLFVMKSVAPPGTTMREIYGAALPFLGCDSFVLLLLLLFPQIALWLPAQVAG